MKTASQSENHHMWRNKHKNKTTNESTKNILLYIFLKNNSQLETLQLESGVILK